MRTVGIITTVASVVSVLSGRALLASERLTDQCPNYSAFPSEMCPADKVSWCNTKLTGLYGASCTASTNENDHTCTLQSGGGYAVNCKTGAE